MAGTRRAPGEGGLREVTLNGKFRHWEGYVYPPGGEKAVDPKTGHFVARFTRRSQLPGIAGAVEVQKALDQALADYTAQEAADARALAGYTIWDGVIAWHAWAPSRKGMSQGTADKLLGQAAKWIEPRIGRVPYTAVDLRLYSAFFDEIADELGADSLSDLKSVLFRSASYAIMEKKFAGPNIAREVDLPEAGHKPREADFLTKEKVEEIFALTEGTPMHVMVVIGFMLGLRPGEIRALKWEHVTDDALYVVKWARAGGDGKTKTRESRRAIELPAYARTAVRWHKAHHGGHEYVCTRGDGRQLDKDTMRRQVAKVFRAAGLDIEDPYVWRHTFASISYDEGVSLKDISTMMGHASEVITAAIYVHRLRPRVTETAAVMDRIWGRKAA